MPDNNEKDSTQFELLREKRFLPFFITQFLGAFNDNFYKQAFIVLISIASLTVAGLESSALLIVAGALFMFPYIPFSGIAGQLADRYEKGRLIQWIKVLEMVIMALAAVGFYLQSAELLLGVLFLMGTQSALFSPLKYTILPQHLKETELIGGNGMVEMGTFTAILVGMIGGGMLIEVDHGWLIVSVVVVAVSIWGWLASRKIIHSPAPKPNSKVSLNIFGSTYGLIKAAWGNREMHRLIWALSWFWTFGAIFVSQFLVITTDYIWAKGQVATLMLAMFSVGIGVGSILCEKLSARKIQPGLAVFGMLGMSVFLLPLYFFQLNHPELAMFASMMPELHSMGLAVGVDHTWFTGTTAALYQRDSIADFMGYDGALMVLLSILLVGMFLGFMGVPLHAMLQHRSSDQERTTMIAANNVINAFYIFAGSLAVMFILGAGVRVEELFLGAAAFNLLFLVWLCVLQPEYWHSFKAWLRQRTS